MRRNKILIYVLPAIIGILIIIFTVLVIMNDINITIGLPLFIILMISILTSLLVNIYTDGNKKEIGTLKQQIADLKNAINTKN